MSTVRRRLPAQPHLDVPKQEASELLRQCQSKSSDALDRVRRRHPKFQRADDETIATRLKLSDARLVIAKKYNFSSWTQLEQRIAGNAAAELILKAIRAGDAAEVTRLLTANPDLLHLPVGEWQLGSADEPCRQPRFARRRKTRDPSAIQSSRNLSTRTGLWNRPVVGYVRDAYQCAASPHLPAGKIISRDRISRLFLAGGISPFIK